MGPCLQSIIVPCHRGEMALLLKGGLVYSLRFSILSYLAFSLLVDYSLRLFFCCILFSFLFPSSHPLPLVVDKLGMVFFLDRRQAAYDSARVTEGVVNHNAKAVSK